MRTKSAAAAMTMSTITTTIMRTGSAAAATIMTIITITTTAMTPTRYSQAGDWKQAAA